MKLDHSSRFIEVPGISALAWDGDELLEPMTGRRIALDQPLPCRTFFIGYPFDRALCIRGVDALWTLMYENRGTKAVLSKNGKVHREINRSYYFAKAFDYPIALTKLQDGRIAIVHCPTSYDTVQVEDAETGEILGKKTSTGMEFHSRLSVSSDGKFLLSAGWFWHPLGGAWICAIDTIRSSDGCPAEEAEFSFGAEIDAAAFLGNRHLVVSSTSEVVDEDTPETGLAPLQLGVWSIEEWTWTSKVSLQEPTGSIMPWKDWVISFHEHPKAIELSTGNVVHVWDHLYSGRQIGAIDLGEPTPPPLAMNPEKGMFAVGDERGVTVIALSASE